MITPAQLRQSRRSYAVVLQGIVRAYGKDKYSIFALVEGKDADYYRPRIGMAFAQLNIEVFFRNCHGKKNLKDLHKAIIGNNLFNDARIIFFFDRDFEHDLAEIRFSNAYVTDGYSIENYYTSQVAVRSAIYGCFFSDAAHSEEEERIVADLLRKFHEIQKKTHECLALFNQWAWVQRHLPRGGKIDLDAFAISDFIDLDIDNESATAAYDLHRLNDMTPERNPVTAGEIAVSKSWFDARSTQAAFRGKQELELLYIFLQWAMEKGTHGSGPFDIVTRCSVRVSKKEMIGDFSMFADTPQSLAEFLSTHRQVWFSP